MTTKTEITLPQLPRLQVPRIDADIDLMDIRRLVKWAENIANTHARAAVEADRRERGEPVAWRWLYNGKPDSETCYPLPLPNAVVRERASAAAFPRTVQVLYASPQPADPVKVPSDDEILAWAGGEQFFLFADPEEVLDIVKSALQHFGQPKPSNSGELEPAASAQPRAQDREGT